MKSVLALLLLTSVCKAAPISISANGSAEIKISNGEAEVSLPAEAKAALKTWNPEFVVFNVKDYSKSVLDLFKDIDPKAVPVGFIADLDANGEKDVVLLGADLRHQYAVALLKKNKQWTPVKVYSWTLTDIRSTSLPSASDPKQKEIGIPIYVLPAQGEHAKKLANKTGIQVETYLGAAEVFEIKDGKAVKFVVK
ncbi:hypothetical protein [Bdellovibrio reynosensis]|uniref:Uncharacterized protein n=1 Tax=Bdellovibrio reynosensis TaxID=2835041 RepID=A0ABY4CFA6_9BACT|nr:hypothetical protein [Bdellovibrio reynosensis]UOF02456.1 hypothetical protein MNR06_05770 [Bdellovibrio reynosensis]